MRYYLKEEYTEISKVKMRCICNKIMPALRVFIENVIWAIFAATMRRSDQGPECLPELLYRTLVFQAFSKISGNLKFYLFGNLCMCIRKYCLRLIENLCRNTTELDVQNLQRLTKLHFFRTGNIDQCFCYSGVTTLNFLYGRQKIVGKSFF